MIHERARATAAASPDAFHDVWPRSFPLGELRQLLGENADALMAEVLARQVNSPVWTLVDRGGKRWRTTIGRLAYRVAGGGEPEPGPVFEVPELLHNASLVIDDIEDAATERRGGAPAHLSYGVPIALNAANAAYFRALAALRGHLDDARRLRALDMLSEELFAAHLGQALDLTLGTWVKLGAKLRTTHYELLARAKTGALVRIAARLGAIAACADARVEGALATWAGELGVAYQIRDDVDDLALGSSDLERGRATYPLLALLEDESLLPRDEVLVLLDGGDARSAAYLEALLEDGALSRRCLNAARAAGGRAIAALETLAPGPSRDALFALTEQLATGGDAS
ncbi:MAG: polyprenyl synthetase family protein [Deltaproteobacteria bacterium]|nr:polyprenyl synthetase family protein [Deltaproteobacteria bacterium]